MKRIHRLVILVVLQLTLGVVPFTLGGCKPKMPEVSAATTEPTFQVEERADPVAAIASLSDPGKLKTLKPEARGINGRLDKILYWVYVAERKGVPSTAALDRAFDQNGTQEPRRSMARKQLESTYLTAKLWGLFAPENLARLKRGNAALITKGTYLGQIAEVDHIVPVSRYPHLANELANLQLMPACRIDPRATAWAPPSLKSWRSCRLW